MRIVIIITLSFEVGLAGEPVIVDEVNMSLSSLTVNYKMQLFILHLHLFEKEGSGHDPQTPGVPPG